MFLLCACCCWALLCVVVLLCSCVPPVLLCVVLFLITLLCSCCVVVCFWSPLSSTTSLLYIKLISLIKEKQQNKLFANWSTTKLEIRGFLEEVVAERKSTYTHLDLLIGCSCGRYTKDNNCSTTWSWKSSLLCHFIRNASFKRQKDQREYHKL